MLKDFKGLVVPLFLIVLILISGPLLESFEGSENEWLSYLFDYGHILVIILVCWTLVALVRGLKSVLLSRYDISHEDNLRSRKAHTQINILQRVLVFIIILFGTGLVLLSFEQIREIGIGLFASAGLAGIIIGLSAQKVVGALLAGIQIAFTQPFRLDDAVYVEGEWGWIEQINLTYVVVRIWDKRRLVLPSTYFLDQPFQNWTRKSADIIGTIFLYTDYTIPFQALRDELSRLLKETDLWDGNVNVLQVTDATQSNVEIRILVSARNSPTAWDLRVHIREKMIEFIQKNYPESLPRTRLVFENKEMASNPAAPD